MPRGLVPTVVTNKNGIVTTVHRKPNNGPKSKVVAPVAIGTDKAVYTLRKAYRAANDLSGPL